jgi:hypothetical protein
MDPSPTETSLTKIICAALRRRAGVQNFTFRVNGHFDAEGARVKGGGREQV